LYSLHKISVSLFLLFLPLTASGGNPYRITTGAREMGMGSVSVVSPGFWTAFQNPAVLAGRHQMSGGVNYENRFGIPELGIRSIGFILPSGKASLGAIYSHFGYSDFRRQNAGIACGMMLSEKISGGVMIDYFSELTSGEYDNNQFISAEAGLLFAVSEKTSLGFVIFNPIPNSVIKNYLPSAIIAGVGIRLSDAVYFGAEAELNSGGSLVARTGFEYEAAKNFRLRGGFSTEYFSFSLGLGYQFKSVTFDLGFATHERLGVTSAASIIIKIR
jgi:hypothetical protein